MKRTLLPFLILATATIVNVRAETETIDLKALAKKARPAVMLLVVSDRTGKEIATDTGFLVSADGKLITNHHVIEHAASAVAKAENGGLYLIERNQANRDANTSEAFFTMDTPRSEQFTTLQYSLTVVVNSRVKGEL